MIATTFVPTNILKFCVIACRLSAKIQNQFRATAGPGHAGNVFEDDFDRAPSENGGPSNGFNGIAVSNVGASVSGNYIKQKDFIIKKMFKVPSNEQMTATGFSAAIATGSTLHSYAPNGGQPATPANAIPNGPLSAKGPSGNPTAGINIFNVNQSGHPLPIGIGGGDSNKATPI